MKSSPRAFIAVCCIAAYINHLLCFSFAMAEPENVFRFSVFILESVFALATLSYSFAFLLGTTK